MSDHIIKIIPTDYKYQMTKEKASNIILQLQDLIHCDRITYRVSRTPEFVDCGRNLDEILCPICKTSAEEWWGNVMNDAYESSAFVHLEVMTHCCGQIASLNDFIYDLPCGFSCVEFDVFNPHSEVALHKIQTELKFNAKIINAQM